MLHEYLIKYLEAFGENFPIYGFMGEDEDKIIKIIKGCLKSGKPYVLNAKKGDYY